MNFLKRHWFLILLSVVLFWAIWTANQTVAKIVTWVYLGLAVAALFIGGGLLGILWPLLGALYAAGYVWGWFPASIYPSGQPRANANANFSAANPATANPADN